MIMVWSFESQKSLLFLGVFAKWGHMGFEVVLLGLSDFLFGGFVSNRKLRQKLGTWRKRLVHCRRDWKRGMHSYKLQQLLLRRSHSYTILFNFVIG